MKMANYHTHTARCKHAVNTDEEYVLAAIEAGYECFGFADHTPWPYEDGFVSGVRMDAAQLNEYIASIRGLKEKYKDKIDIRVGLECEYYPAYLDWLEKTANQKHIQYLILGSHHNLTDNGGFYFGASTEPDHIRLYAERTVAAMRTGMFAYLAHPDLVMRGYPVFDSACRDMAYELCQTANEMHMPLEYNLMGNEYKKLENSPWKGAGYPDDHFWQIAAEMKCTAIIGLDSHKAEHVRHGEDYHAAEKYLDGLGINRVSEIPMRCD